MENVSFLYDFLVQVHVVKHRHVAKYCFVLVQVVVFEALFDRRVEVLVVERQLEAHLLFYTTAGWKLQRLFLPLENSSSKLERG